MRPTHAGLQSALLATLALSAGQVRAEETLPRELEGVGVEERLGAMIDPDLPFTDHTGARVTLGKYLDDGIPVLLTLNYYRCKMLCNLQLNAVVEGLKGLEWKPGENFRIVTISIDPREGWELGRDKRASYLETLGRGEVDWSFLVGRDEDVRTVARTVGFSYKYDQEQDQYAHTAAIFFLSPEGKVSRYLYGVDYPSQSLKFALMEASEGRIGTTIDKVILSCFHYDSSIGAYGPFAFGIMRLGAALTATLLIGWLGVMFARDRLRRRAEDGI
ncbi:MAG: photosynthetic protein synthase I [Myxococcales bacterium]